MAEFTYVNATGTIIADTADTKTQIEELWTAAFGADIDLDSSTVEGLIAATQVIIMDSVVNNNALMANQINPNLTTGIFLDSLSALTALSRNAAIRSTVTAQLTGVAGTNIPSGSIASTTGGDEFASDVAVILDGNGEGSVGFSSVETGLIACPINSLTNIVSNVIGWETVDNAVAAVLGNKQESDIALSLRRRRTLALQGVSISEAVKSAVNAVDGVDSMKYRENVKAIVQVIDGVTLDPHSIYVAVSGGSDEDVALALLESKSGGAGWNSEHNPIMVMVTDNDQDYTVEFDRQTDVPIFAEVEIDANGVTDSINKVKDAIIAYANSELDGQDGFVVGANASPFEMSGAINAVHPQIIVRKFEIGIIPSPVNPVEINIEIWEQATIVSANISVTVV